MILRLARRVKKGIPLLVDMRAVSASGLFVRDWYLAQNPDVAKASVNPLAHYLCRGGFEGRDPSPHFDSDWYLAENPDVALAAINPLIHYLRWGGFEGRDPSPHFDSDGYLAENLSVAKAGVNPLVHYLRWGASEGRVAKTSGSWKKEQHSAARVAEAPVARQGALVRNRRPRVVFVSGESYPPGHRHRIVNIAACLAPRFFETVLLRGEELPERLGEIAGADIVWIWRAAWSEQVARLLQAARREGAKIVFDVDDLMFRPELAKTQIIDGIRSQGLSEAEVEDFYGRVQRVLAQADHCTTPTFPLARETRDLWKPTTVIPNGFDRNMLEASRSAHETQKTIPDDGLIRIGYAAGSRTHQRDLAVASQSLAAALSENPNARLVLFRKAVELSEIPELEKLADQIEWRDLVPVDKLAFEYARFDINLAPLEVGNAFCEAKSELKFFEAALAGVPTIASPTKPFKDAIRHGETGFLANSDDEWYTCLCKLIQDKQLRERTAERAYREVLWRYGPERRSLLVTRLINRLLAPFPLASDLFRLETDSEASGQPPEIDVPEYSLIYQSARRSLSRVSVVIPLFNYGKFLGEALESVRHQSIRNLDVIIVDDRSTDDSVAVARTWLEHHASEFNMVALLQNRQNSKLGPTRNAAISFSDTEFFFPLDPDNLLLPDCIEKCLAMLDETGAGFAYPTLQYFGNQSGTSAAYEYDPAIFQSGNYIDAMALIRKACWIGGLRVLVQNGAQRLFWC
jgi:glycosyltransferase involved in cell wall biosynthesis